MNIFQKIKLVFTYGSELQEILDDKRKAREEAERLARLRNLHLCLEHQQERNRSHYSPKNCHHCKLIEELKQTKRDLFLAEAGATNAVIKEELNND